MKAQEYLRSIGACAEAREWVGNKSLREAWSTCPRADWMLWLLDKRAPLTKEQAVQLACAFARRVLPLVPAGEARPRLAIEAAEQWLVTPSPENRANAATAAKAAKAAKATYAAYAAYAAYAGASAAAATAAYAAYAATAAKAAKATYAAYAAYAGASAAADATYAAYSAASAGASAAAADATYAAAATAACADAADARRALADIVRALIPCPVRSKP